MVDFVTLLPASDVLTIEKLAQYELGVSWRYIQASGVAVPDSSADQLESLWNAHLISLDRKQEVLPHEIIAPSQYVEGAVKRAYVNRYERNSKARKKCLEIYGHNCTVCDFNFEDVFGKLGSKYIHVHHLRELAMVGEQYEVNPENDLRPVCPNCHAMLHNGEKLLSIEELKAIRNSSAK